MPPAIEARLDELELDYIEEDLPKTLASMQVGSDRISEIVTSLRNFSRIDEAEIKPVDIHTGIDSTLLLLQNRLKPQAKSPGIKIVKEYGDLPEVECHASQLNQVFMNLLANAIDALDEQIAERSTEDLKNCPPTIEICSVLKDANTVTISIADNGPGIPPELSAKLFDPFFTTKPVGKGTGLGLSISQKIVGENHGGTLSCSTPGSEGTEFIIELPLHATPKRAREFAPESPK